MTYAVAVLYLLGAVLAIDFVNLTMAAHPTFRRFTPGVRSFARGVIALLWPAVPVFITVKVLRDQLKG